MLAGFHPVLAKPLREVDYCQLCEWGWVQNDETRYYHVLSAIRLVLLQEEVFGSAIVGPNHKFILVMGEIRWVGQGENK